MCVAHERALHMKAASPVMAVRRGKKALAAATDEAGGSDGDGAGG